MHGLWISRPNYTFWFLFLFLACSLFTCSSLTRYNLTQCTETDSAARAWTSVTPLHITPLWVLIHFLNEYKFFKQRPELKLVLSERNVHFNPVILIISARGMFWRMITAYSSVTGHAPSAEPHRTSSPMMPSESWMMHINRALSVFDVKESAFFNSMDGGASSPTTWPTWLPFNSQLGSIKKIYKWNESAKICFYYIRYLTLIKHTFHHSSVRCVVIGREQQGG